LKNPKPLILAVAVFFLLGLASLAALIFLENRQPAIAGSGGARDDLSVYGKAPRFELTGVDGSAFSSRALAGKVWVADFFFSTCGGPCPLMAANMKTLQEAFADRDDVRLVNFTVNPLYDTPAVLQKYAAKLGADADRWHFLTGDGEEIHRISVKGFKIGDPDNLILHSEKFVLVDRHGRVRGYYEGTSAEETQTLIRDIKRLLAERDG